MPDTDIEERVAQAVVAILAADAQIQTLCGRATGLVKEWAPIEELTLPVLLQLVVVLVKVGPGGQDWRGSVQITAVAEGNGSSATARALLERAELVLTQPAFIAQNLDAMPLRVSRQPVQQGREGSRNLALGSLDVEILVTK